MQCFTGVEPAGLEYLVCGRSAAAPAEIPARALACPHAALDLAVHVAELRRLPDRRYQVRVHGGEFEAAEAGMTCAEELGREGGDLSVAADAHDGEGDVLMIPDRLVRQDAFHRTFKFTYPEKPRRLQGEDKEAPDELPEFRLGAFTGKRRPSMRALHLLDVESDVLDSVVGVEFEQAIGRVQG